MIHMQSKCLKQTVRLVIVATFLFIVSGLLYNHGFADSQRTAEKKKKALIPEQQTAEPISMLTLPEGAKVSERIISLQGLSNVGKVSPVIFRGAQPLPEGYLTLKNIGVKTIINLRSKHSEKKEVESAGMKSIQVPMDVLKDVDIKTINSVIDMMINMDNQPVYVHCKLGQDRTGIVIAAYRMRVERWSLKEAEAEMQLFGFNDLWWELKEFIREYAKSLGE